ncbi:MAG: hypothetical protein KDE51_11060 [Anaerolineales bacterium]|nr:hypothetical protein [Anaerolineales bacterium]
MDNLQLFYYMRDGLGCLGALIGLGASLSLLSRQQHKAGLLALLGFACLAIEPAADYVIWQQLSFVEEVNFDLLEMVYALAGVVSLFGGMVLLTAALVTAAGGQAPAAQNDDLAQQVLGQTEGDSRW